MQRFCRKSGCGGVAAHRASMLPVRLPRSPATAGAIMIVWRPLSQPLKTTGLPFRQPAMDRDTASRSRSRRNICGQKENLKDHWP
jgi:hypothetical protein